MGRRVALSKLIALANFVLVISNVAAEQLPKIGGSSGDSPAPIFPTSAPADLDPTISIHVPAVTTVPEPATVAMMLLGGGCLGGLTFLRRRRRR